MDPIEVPSYFPPRPPMDLDAGTIGAFDRLLAESIQKGSVPVIDYTLSAPKWQFLCYLCEAKDVLLHGSGNPDIQEFEPRQSNDTQEFGNRQAVYAASDGIWPIFFAITDKVRAVWPQVPVIVFARGVGAGHKRIGELTKAEALSVETSLPLAWARSELAGSHAVQGNLDPLLVEKGGMALEMGVELIARALPKDRHIFNLGHGMRPGTPPDHVEQVVRHLRNYDG